MRFFLTACFIVTIGLFHSSAVFGQELRVEPPDWWVGMQDNKVQLLVHGDGVGSLDPAIQYPGVALAGVHRAESPNYLFLDLSIDATALPGRFAITFSSKGKTVHTFLYELNSRKMDPVDYQGFTSEDAIYLITPDRFANGDPANDVHPEMKEKGIDRSRDYARHGGDIVGITASLDYIETMGFTAIWPSPLLTNDMPRGSYHGYAITDYYQVDPRFGTLEEYTTLAEEARSRGVKLIMDVVSNHCGSGHWWMDDLPFSDWLNFQDSMQVTSHRRTVNQDPYAAEVDLKKMTGGWFVPSMPDLNQQNPFLSNYLIQNSIWWIETLGLGGIRQDTWPYPDKEFLKDWSCRIMEEYPNFSIVGEEWSYNPLLVAYWQQGHQNRDGYETCLASTMDFPMQKNLAEALREKESWDQGLIKLYEGLANDFAYAFPERLLIFGDNHDMDRIHTQLKEDPALTKMAIAWLLTSRGIPQFYYGTEILMENSEKPGDHGLIRTDFPGGWQGDAVNAFTGTGLTGEQRDMQVFMKKLLNWRKQNPVIHVGETLHFAPDNGTYTFFRYNENKTVMVVFNKQDSPVALDLSRFTEVLQGKTSARNVLTDARLEFGKTLPIPSRSVIILEM